MKSYLNTALKSMGAGAFVSILVLGVAAILDTFINPKTANFISLLVGLVINFILQQMVFIPTRSSNTAIYLLKYIIADVLILGSNQYLVSYLIDNKEEYKRYVENTLDPFYNTISRIIVGAIIWVILSYPLRKYWVFVLH